MQKSFGMSKWEHENELIINSYRDTFNTSSASNAHGLLAISHSGGILFELSSTCRIVTRAKASSIFA